ncbi:MAG: hypothetical protein ABSC61_04905 [Anaerolineales bacterium]
MGSFSQEDQILVWQENQQTVWLQPWGVDGLRVQATLAGKRLSLPQALLEPAARTKGTIERGQEMAVLRNGSICAKISRGRKVYLPAGTEWTDAEKGTPHPGGEWRSGEAPLERVPVFLKKGSGLEKIFRPGE